MYSNKGKVWFRRLVSKDNGNGKALFDKMPGADFNGIIIAREIQSKDLDEKGKRVKYMNYTRFDSYFDLYDFIKKETQYFRNYHEVVGSFRMQKPRFDVDIDLDKYKKIKELEPELSELPLILVGEFVKDLVIKSVKKVMKTYGYKLDLSRDIMIFNSHGQEKRSYHIILNRYYHTDSMQAEALYLECLKITDFPKVFSLLVDPGIYSKNHPLRLLWNTKVGDSSRPKKYQPEFEYRGVKYTHIISHYISNIDEDKEIEIDKSVELVLVFANSLITFVDECNPMPILPVRKTSKRETVEISDDMLEECKELIEIFDKDENFAYDCCDGGIISLKRKNPSYCSLCDRVHDAYPPFCYIYNSVLYWHCGRIKAPGLPIGRLSTVRSLAESQICTLFGLTEYSVENARGQIVFTGNYSSNGKPSFEVYTYDGEEFSSEDSFEDEEDEILKRLKKTKPVVETKTRSIFDDEDTSSEEEKIVETRVKEVKVRKVEEVVKTQKIEEVKKPKKIRCIDTTEIRKQKYIKPQTIKKEKKAKSKDSKPKKIHIWRSFDPIIQSQLDS